MISIMIFSDCLRVEHVKFCLDSSHEVVIDSM